MDKPIIRVYSEASSAQEAEKLASGIKKEIARIGPDILAHASSITVIKELGFELLQAG